MSSRFHFVVILAGMMLPIIIGNVTIVTGTEPADPKPNIANLVWLGFPIIDRREQPTEINLAQDETLGSAFLLQLRRQALLIAARDELGALTRDAFLDETAPNDAIRIPDIDTFPGADPEYVDHRQFLADVEKLSREKFVIELRKLGLEKHGDATNETGVAHEETTQIEKLLDEWALVPQFDAVRRTHATIRQYGETPERLAFLVRGYTQLQIHTNFAPRDSHRVFQARAMLYAQRLVAKYGETPDHLSLRAAAWSLNNFHRLARLEFQAMTEKEIPISQEPWIRAARCYADFDFRGLESMMETGDPKSGQLLAKLLYYYLTEFSGQGKSSNRSFGESIFADLPDCSTLYARVYGINTFDMVYAPDGCKFYEHLARRIAPAVRRMPDIPESVEKTAAALHKTVRKPTSDFLGFFGGGGSSRAFPLEKYFLDLARLIEALNESALSDDRDEPSLAMLGMLLQDETMQTVQLVAKGLRGRNSASENIVLPALPVLESHIGIDFLGSDMRDPEARNPYWRHLTREADVPYNLFSQHAHGFGKNWHEAVSFGRIYSPGFFAQLFSDRENVRDMIKYHLDVVKSYPKHKHYFLADWLMELCPNNPFAAGIHLSRSEEIKPDDVKAFLEKFSDSDYDAYETAIEIYFHFGYNDELLELLESDVDIPPTDVMTNQLMVFYLKLQRYDDAVAVLEKFIESPNSDHALRRYREMLNIGKILLLQGKFDEAKPYFQAVADTHSAWGLSAMANYLEIMGDFEQAERYLVSEMRSYPEVGPFEWWACCYRINSPNLQKAMDAIFERFERYVGAAHEDSATRVANRIHNYQVIYPCYCMDVPIPAKFGSDPTTKEFYVTGYGILGFWAWLEAMEKKDSEKAKKLLNQMRELSFLDGKHDPFQSYQQNAGLKERQYVDYPYQRFAALIQVDQQSDNPGELDTDEMEYLLHRGFQHEMDPGMFQWLLYLFGRYYDFCGKPDKAKDCYRRVLGVRVEFHYFLRNLAVKELRKTGMTDEEYVNFSQGDPRFPRLKISFEQADHFCRQHFRDYSESPATSVLERPVADKPVAASNFGKTTALKPGAYKVTKILFRGNAVPEKENAVYWFIPTDKHDSQDWRFQGIAGPASYETSLEQQRKDGVYPLRYGILPAWATFHDGHLALTISLKENEEPKSMTPSPESDVMRIEMRRVSDFPVEEPLWRSSRDVSDGGDSMNDPPKHATENRDPASWTGPARIVAVGIAITAILLAAVLSYRKKRCSKHSAEK